MEDMLAKTERINNLIDYYLPLFNKRQQDMLVYYYREDLSLQEVANHMKITRQGVHDSLQRSINQMEKTEKALRLIEKNQKHRTIMTELQEKLRRLSAYLPPTITAEITQIMQKFDEN
ncbi:MAG: DNA-binding protein [Firmicutes bacterium]|nr:DNA-binding protein [Bacillota bacterium]